ncbi:MAG TPA: hypothetical protein VKA07_10495 [Candidatus Sulfotelmatobacter sp.]|nr:hypothetical protein [Candidatus Sulfotelmatobacter sp.]
MQLGLDNKKNVTGAVVLGVVAVLALAYEFIPMLAGPSTPPTSSAEAAGPAAIRVSTHGGAAGAKSLKKARTETLDPTLRLDLLASSELTQYEGTGRNIFVPQAEEVKIQTPLRNGTIDHKTTEAAAPPTYVPPAIPVAPPIPLKFYGFANQPGEPRKVFLEEGEDVWVAGEGEIVNRRYKVIRITPNSVSIQDVVNSGPPQNIPLTSGQGQG